MEINGGWINEAEINAEIVDYLVLSAYLRETSTLTPTLRIDIYLSSTLSEMSGSQFDLTDVDRLNALLSETSGLSGTMAWSANAMAANLPEQSGLTTTMTWAANNLSATVTETSSLTSAVTYGVNQLTAELAEISALSLDTTIKFVALLEEASALQATATWAPNSMAANLTEHPRLYGAANMPIRIRTGIMRAIQIPFHGEVVS